MYYKLVQDGALKIEFFNDWLGVEKVVVNDNVVSKKSSVWGIDHHFEAVESGKKHYYVLTTKVGANMGVFIDLKKDGELIQSDIPIPVQAKPSKPKNDFKHRGKNFVKTYDLEEGIAELKQAINYSPQDPEIYFFLACGYSVLEDAENGFESLQSAVTNNLQDQGAILTHEMLSFLRMHPSFEAFKESGFKEYEL